MAGTGRIDLGALIFTCTLRLAFTLRRWLARSACAINLTASSSWHTQSTTRLWQCSHAQCRRLPLRHLGRYYSEKDDRRM